MHEKGKRRKCYAVYLKPIFSNFLLFFWHFMTHTFLCYIWERLYYFLLIYVSLSFPYTFPFFFLLHLSYTYNLLWLKLHILPLKIVCRRDSFIYFISSPTLKQSEFLIELYEYKSSLNTWYLCFFFKEKFLQG